MKIVKLFAWLLALIVALVIAALVYVSFNLNGIVKRGVEEVGPNLTHTQVKLGKVDITLTEGRVSLLDFSIANPTNFTSPNAFEFAEFSLQIDPASLSENVIVIQNIIVSGIKITAEQKGNKTNLQEIKQAIDSYLPPGSAESTEASSGNGKRFMVENMKFEKASLNLITEKYGEKLLSLPAIEQKNIGNKQEGITGEQLASILLKSLTENAKRASEKELKKVLTDEAKASAKEKIQEEADKGLDKLKGLLKK